MSGKACAQHRDDDPLGGEIGLGHRRRIALLRDLERVGVDAHRRLAAGERGAQRNLEQRIGHLATAIA